MTNDHTGRTPRQTTGGAPAASTIMIVVTVVAVVIGFFILKKIRDDGTATSLEPGTTINAKNTTSSAPGTVVVPTTVPADVKTGTKVQVANSSSSSGVASKLTTDLQANGYTTGGATDASGPNVPATLIYYDAANPAAKPVADTLGRAMGGVEVQPMPAVTPTNSGKLDAGVGVLVLLGNDRAGKTLSQMSTPVSTATTLAGAPPGSLATTTTVKKP